LPGDEGDDTGTPSGFQTQEVVQGGNNNDNDNGPALDCSFPSTGKLLTFCATHDFNMVAPKLIGFETINMTECATVDIQNVP
jgi:hypothetical protein